MTPQELKNSILWLAIQGKITTQNRADGNAIDSLAAITLSTIETDEFLFDIPASWIWVKLQDIFEFVNGRAFKPSDWSADGLKIIRIQNLNDPTAPYNYFSGNAEDRHIVKYGELLFSWSGTPGTSFGAFIWNGETAVLNQHIFRVLPKIDIDFEYARYALNGEIQNFIDQAHGSAGLQHITKKKLDNSVFPLPPLAEQQRIVAKIEVLLPYIDRYEQAWSKLADFNKRFPDDMQKSILQMAIQGKLVKQLPEEGTGEELYQRIQVEKQDLIKAGTIKKDKPLPEITEDEKPFEIPESWKWVRLKDIATKITDGTHNSPPNTETGDFMYVTAKNIKNSGVSLKGITYVSANIHEQIYARCNPNLGDLLLIKDGATTGVVTVNNLVEQFSMLSSVALLKLPQSVNAWYLVYALRSDLFYKILRAQMKGTGITRITLTLIEPMIIPLPPLAEQKRIVAKLEEILPLCEKLKR